MSETTRSRSSTHAIVIMVGAAFVDVIVACTPSQRQDVKSGIDAVQPFLDATCLILNQALPDEEALRICKVQGPLLDVGKSFLVTARTTTDREVSAKMTRMVSSPCAPLASSGSALAPVKPTGDAGK